MIRHGDDLHAFSELDLAILHALQVDGRAPWTRVAAAVGADAATVARHWQAMADQSLAWLTAWPTPQRWSESTDVAVVLLDPATSVSTLDDLARLPWVLSVDETSAGPLVLVAGAGGLPLLAERVREIDGHGGIVRRMDVAAAILGEDSAWRLRALSRQQEQMVREPVRGEVPRPPHAEVVTELAAVLEDDPRLPAAAVAAQLGVSEATARRTIDRAVASGQIRIGCDLAMPSAGYRRGAVLWARAADPEQAAVRAARLPQTHRVGLLVGAAPLYVGVRARSLTDLAQIEAAWGPGVEVADRWTVLRAVKRNGHLLGEDGRTIGRVPPRW